MTDETQTEQVEPEIGVRDRDGMDRWNRNAESANKGGAPKGNTYALKHGIFADRFLSPEEKPLFDAIIAQLQEDFVFNKSSDFIQVELVAVYFLKLGRAQEAGDWEAAERLDRMIRCHMRELKTTKLTREGTEPSEPQTTPAEWATALLEKLAAAEKKAECEAEPEKTQE